MEAIAERLETKLHQWKPETSQKVRLLVAEIIELADDDALDIGRSRAAEQEVLNILDAPATR
jgi:predicted amino acid racemase